MNQNFKQEGGGGGVTSDLKWEIGAGETQSLRFYVVLQKICLWCTNVWIHGVCICNNYCTSLYVISRLSLTRHGYKPSLSITQKLSLLIVSCLFTLVLSKSGNLLGHLVQTCCLSGFPSSRTRPLGSPLWRFQVAKKSESRIYSMFLRLVCKTLTIVWSDIHSKFLFCIEFASYVHVNFAFVNTTSQLYVSKLNYKKLEAILELVQVTVSWAQPT